MKRSIVEINNMINIRILKVNKALNNNDKQSALLNLLDILDFIKLRCDITGENYDKVAIYIMNQIKEKYI